MTDEEIKAAQRLDAACRLDPEIWFMHFGKIVKDNGDEVIGPDPTSVQKREFEHYRRCMKAGKPCKMLVYKSRRHGASTGAQAILYHHGMRRKIKLKSMAHKDEASAEIQGIFKTLANGDRFPWFEGVANVRRDLADVVELASGTEVRFLSAQADEPGRGGAAQGSEITEVAHYKETGAKDPLTAFLQSVKAALVDPVGVVIADSTPAGAFGWFYDMVMQVMEKKRKGTWTLDDYEFIFEPWWTLPDSTMSFGSQEEFDAFVESMDADELEEFAKYSSKGVTYEHMKWRRNVIDNLLKGDPEKFKQEYPSDPIEGFLGAGRPKFNAIALTKMRAKAQGVQPRRGELDTRDEEDNDAAVFIPDPRGSFEFWEDPRWGCRYLVSVDTMTGEDQIDDIRKSDPDWHAIHCWRDEFEDCGVLKAPMLVARHSSQLDIFLAAELARKLAAYYGGCIIIPEVNNSGLAMVKYLEERGASVYSRRRIRATEEQQERQLGWKTDPSTRKTIIDHLAKAFREGKAEILSEAVLDQMQSFVSNKSGKYEALPGKHDDEVLAAAIGHYNLPLACVRTMPKRRKLGGDRRFDSFAKPGHWRRG